MVVIAILGLIVSGCSIPLKSVVPTSEKGNSKPELGTPTIEKITFIHYAKSSGHSKPVWDDTEVEEDDFKFLVGGIKWFDTIFYEVSTYEMPGYLVPAVVRSKLEESLETWDDAVTDEFFNAELFSDTIIITDGPVVSGDEKNTVGWGSLNSGIIAVAYLRYNPATKEIVESDIIFNAYYAWSTDDESIDGAMDLQNIATHEFGHNGLNDLRPPKDGALTMYGYSDFGDIDKRDLGYGDILGIKKLYGSE